MPKCRRLHLTNRPLAPTARALEGLTTPELLHLLHSAEWYRYLHGHALPDEAMLVQEARARGLR